MKDVISIISDAHLSKIRNVNKNLKETSPNFKETIYSSYQWGAVFDVVIFIKEHMEVKAFISHFRKIWLSHFSERLMLIVKGVNLMSFLDSFPNLDCLILNKMTYRAYSTSNI